MEDTLYCQTNLYFDPRLTWHKGKTLNGVLLTSSCNLDKLFVVEKDEKNGLTIRYRVAIAYTLIRSV